MQGQCFLFVCLLLVTWGMQTRLRGKQGLPTALLLNAKPCYSCSAASIPVAVTHSCQSSGALTSSDTPQSKAALATAAATCVPGDGAE